MKKEPIIIHKLNRTWAWKEKIRKLPKIGSREDLNLISREIHLSIFQSLNLLFKGFYTTLQTPSQSFFLRFWKRSCSSVSSNISLSEIFCVIPSYCFDAI